MTEYPDKEDDDSNDDDDEYIDREYNRVTIPETGHGEYDEDAFFGRSGEAKFIDVEYYVPAASQYRCAGLEDATDLLA